MARSVRMELWQYRALQIAAAISLALALSSAAHSQQRLAEGEYVMRDAEAGASAKTFSRWVLYGSAAGGYRLESEIQNLPAGLRVLQKDELDTRFVPTAISHELYNKGENKPVVVLTCKFISEAIRCSGESDKGSAPISEQFTPGGPFWFLVRDLSAQDMAWSFAGALNMVRASEKKALLKTIVVSGGAALVLTDKLNVAYLESVKRPGQTVTAIVPKQYTAWDFSGDEEMDVALKGSELLEIGGAKISAQHYTVGSGDELMHAWITSSGLLVKILLSRANESSEIMLDRYKQYVKLVPELGVENPPAAQPKK